MKKTLAKTLLATTMLAAGLTMSTAAFAQSGEIRGFVGITAGNSSFDTKDTKTAIERAASNVKIGGSSTGFKVFAGVEGNRSIGGLDYIRWGKSEREYTVTTGNAPNTTTQTYKTSVSPTSIMPWYGFKFRPGGGNFIFTPRIGYALNSGKAKNTGLAANTVKNLENGLAFGTMFEWSLNDSTAIGLHIDSVNDVGILTSVGIRYGF